MEMEFFSRLSSSLLVLRSGTNGSEVGPMSKRRRFDSRGFSKPSDEGKKKKRVEGGRETKKKKSPAGRV